MTIYNYTQLNIHELRILARTKGFFVSKLRKHEIISLLKSYDKGTVKKPEYSTKRGRPPLPNKILISEEHQHFEILQIIENLKKLENQLQKQIIKLEDFVKYD